MQARNHIARARRITGWSCIVLGKLGTGLLFWAVLTRSDVNPNNDFNLLFGMIGIAPLFAMTIGVIVIGLWILHKDSQA